MLRTLFRRPLPAPCIALSSEEGQKLFQEALADGHCGAFFPLIEHFHTQAEPAYCGLATLVVILNALNIDPQRVWKGPWRFFSEELLDCCVPLDFVKENGITFDEFVCVGNCNGAQIRRFSPLAEGLGEFRQSVLNCTALETHGTRRPEDRNGLGYSQPTFLAVSYSRRTLAQTGDGHFSPVGAYHKASDMALVLDTARFKYPPHWVPVPLLYDATQPHDATTGKPRGWCEVTRSKEWVLSVSVVEESSGMQVTCRRKGQQSPTSSPTMSSCSSCQRPAVPADPLPPAQDEKHLHTHLRMILGRDWRAHLNRIFKEDLPGLCGSNCGGQTPLAASLTSAAALSAVGTVQRIVQSLTKAMTVDVMPCPHEHSRPGSPASSADGDSCSATSEVDECGREQVELVRSIRSMPLYTLLADCFPGAAQHTPAAAADNAYRLESAETAAVLLLGVWPYIEGWGRSCAQDGACSVVQDIREILSSSKVPTLLTEHLVHLRAQMGFLTQFAKSMPCTRCDGSSQCS